MLKAQTTLFAAAIALAALAGACGDSVSSAASPIISVTPQALLFEDKAVGESDLQSLLIENRGEGVLLITDIDVNGPGQSFQIVDGYTGGTLTIEPGSSTELFVSYTRESEDGTASGALVMTHNDVQTDGVTRVPLQVRESAARLFVNPNPINFGRVASGGHSEINTAITNIGGSPLTVTDFFIVGGNGVFTIPDEAMPTFPITLAPDERYEFIVAYDPIDDGFDSAVLIVKSNDASTEDGNFEVEILANGAEPCIEIAPNDNGAYDFGERVVERTSQEPFTIRNCSDPTFGETLVVSQIVLTDDSSTAFGLAQLPDFPLELLPGEDRAFIVEFTPVADQQIEEGTLLVSSNDTYTPELEIDLNGIGTTNECPVARAVCTVEDSGAPPVTDLFVLPLDTLSCNASGSEDSDGSIVEYIWTVAEAPAGSTSEFIPDNREDTSFFVDLAGRYVMNLEVVDDRGCVSEPSPITLVARPDEDIHVQLVWTTPSDPDETDIGFGAGTDLDLHVLHPNGCWEDTTWDCHFRQREPNWGDPGAGDDDPSLDIDDTDGAGPENINLDNPENGVTYKVAAHYYNDHGYGVSFATVRIFVFGELVFEAADKEFPYTDFWWEVAAISWPSTEITGIDLVYDDVPPCGF